MEIGNERKEELLEKYLMHYNMVTPEELEGLTVSELEFLIRAAEVHHEKKTMAADNFLQKAEVFRRSCADGLLRLKNVYIAWDEKTGYPHVMGDGAILIFSEKEYAQKAKEHYDGLGLSLHIQEVVESKQKLFWADCHWWGMEQLVLDVGTYSTRLARELLLPAPDYSDVPEISVPVSNPQLMLAVVRHRQVLFEEKKDEQWKRTEHFLCDRMLKEIVKGRYLCPVQMEGLEGTQPDAEGRMVLTKDTKVKFALLTDKEGQQWLPVFTDWKAFRRIYNDKEWKGQVVSYQDVVALSRDHGFVINPGGLETRVEEKRKQILADYRRRYERLQEEMASGRLQEKRPGLYLGAPGDSEEYGRLLETLTAYMKKQKEIRRAYLAVKVERQDDLSYYLVVEHKGDAKEVLGNIVKAVEGALGYMRMDLAEWNEKTRDLVEGMEPVYKRGFLGL